MFGMIHKIVAISIMCPIPQIGQGSWTLGLPHAPSCCSDEFGIRHGAALSPSVGPGVASSLIGLEVAPRTLIPDLRLSMINANSQLVVGIHQGFGEIWLWDTGYTFKLKHHTNQP